MVLLALVSMVGSGVCAQAAPRALASPVAGYLVDPAAGGLSVVGGPPVSGSAAEQLDFAVTRMAQTVPVARYRQAKLDEESLLPRFEDAFGRMVDPRDEPALIRLVARSQVDVTHAVAAIKDRYHRARPFQRLHLARVCSPDPAGGKIEGDSYPSGHAARGWLLALILSDIAPERRQALLDRAADYGLSREICGMHFASDVEAGHVLAVGIFGRLDADPRFRADIACAVLEYGRPQQAEPARLACEGTTMPHDRVTS